MTRRLAGGKEPAKQVIDDLARRTGRAREEVEKVFAEQLELLQAEAKVTHYIIIFAKRRTEEALRR